MSWQTINQLLIRATIDACFAKKLLADPLCEVSEVELQITPYEHHVICNAKVKDISELSQLLLTQLDREEE